MTLVLRPLVLVLGLLATLVACTAPPPAPGVNDPFEATNRARFEANMALLPSARAEAPPRPNPFRRAVANVGDLLGTPSSILNDVLQLRPDHAVENALRLTINATVGLGGILDPAGHLGIHGRRSDFGETLHRWGVGEGAYVVLPLFGPSTERDAAGLVVDLAIDPLRFVLPPREFGWSLALRGAGQFASAAENADLLDANVMSTADPYAQARLLYLQSRRYHLGVETEDEFIDPYADF